MFLRFLKVYCVIVVASSLAAASPALKVCADPRQSAVLQPASAGL